MPSSKNGSGSDGGPNKGGARSSGAENSFSSFAAGPSSTTKRRSLSRSRRAQTTENEEGKQGVENQTITDSQSESSDDEENDQSISENEGKSEDKKPLRAIRALGNTPSGKTDTDDLFERRTAADFIAEGVVDDVDDLSTFAAKDDIRFGIDDLKDPFKEEAQKQDAEAKKLSEESIGKVVDVTGDGGVTKTLLAPGSGAKVLPGSQVLVQYTGKLEDGSVFDSTRDRDDGGFSFKLGMGTVIKGWEAAVSTMRVGEKSEYSISPNYAYGRRGMPPVIPGNATLTFEIELLEMKGGQSDEQVQNVVDFNPDLPRTPEDIAINYEMLKADRAEKRKTMTFFDRFYIISPFQSQTGEKPPWWINPNITFFIVTAFVGIGFYLVWISGAIHVGYVDHPVDVNIFKKTP